MNKKRFTLKGTMSRDVINRAMIDAKERPEF